MTEREALEAAKENVEAAMSALANYPGDSYPVDEAFDLLGHVLLALRRAVEHVELTPDIGGPGVWDGTTWDDTG